MTSWSFAAATAVLAVPFLALGGDCTPDAGGSAANLFELHASAIGTAATAALPGKAEELLPVLEIAERNHFSYGVALGRAVAARVAEVVSSYPLLPPLRDLAATPSGSRQVRQLLQAAQSCFPDLVQELRGLAAGSEVPFEDLLLLNLRSELEPFLAPQGGDFVGDGCSDILLPAGDGNSADSVSLVALLGHNEDGSGAFRNTSFVVHASIGDSLPFTAHYYAGFLGTWAWQSLMCKWQPLVYEPVG